MKEEWWDQQWDQPEDFLSWLGLLAEQWQRVLKPNGSLYCFAFPRMAAHIELLLGKRFKVLNHLIWDKRGRSLAARQCKEKSRAFFPESERIIFCEQYETEGMALDGSGYKAQRHRLWSELSEPLRAYFVAERKRGGFNSKQIIEATGGYSVERHAFGRSQWELPTREKYIQLQQGLPGYFLRPYESLRRDFEAIRREYESRCQEFEILRRPMNLTSEVPYTDVWAFPPVPSSEGDRHPCQKPAALIEHIIATSSRPGDMVLDCFAGSGSTLIAAKGLGRNALGIEIDSHWVSVGRERLAGCIEGEAVGAPAGDKPRARRRHIQFSLFSEAG